jgi:hypothetical protein
MKFFMEVDLNIWYNFCIGNFDQRSTIFKWKTHRNLNLERICLNLFQICFKLMITSTISTRLHELNPGVLQCSPLKGNLASRFRTEGFTEEVTHASLRREKLWIPGMEEILSLPCSLLLGMMTTLNLVEANRPSPHDLVLLTKKLHWML